MKVVVEEQKSLILVKLLKQAVQCLRPSKTDGVWQVKTFLYVLTGILGCPGKGSISTVSPKGLEKLLQFSRGRQFYLSRPHPLTVIS